MTAIVLYLILNLICFDNIQAESIVPVPCGTYGTLIIYGTDVNLSLDYLGAFEDDSWAQSICDDPLKGTITNFSDYYGYDVSLIIADHKHQGFNALYDVIPNKTKARIFYPDGTSQQYICREKTNGENDGFLWVDGQLAELVYPSDWLCMYTCNPEGWWTVTVTFWEPLY